MVKHFWIVFLLVLVFDQFVKFVVRTLDVFYQPLPFFGFTHVTNTGGIFGLLNGSNGIMIVLSVLVLGALYYFRKHMPTSELGKTSFGLLVGGISGNLVDRIFFGGVTDFISIWIWPTFNIADAALVLGILGILWAERFNA